MLYMLVEKLHKLLEGFNNQELIESDVIHWGAPVPSFGNVSRSRVATLGLNPSNKEFVDNRGNELNGVNRRFHTLASLGLDSWSEADNTHIEQIIDSCKEYFNRNPYDSWFKSLDYLISGTSASYYFPSSEACHLDLIPYATSSKWAELSLSQRQSLLAISGDSLGLLLKDSPIEMLVLNGRTVVETFEKLSKVDYIVEEMEEWTLPRSGSSGIKGYAYRSFVNEVGNIKIGREILVLGYNHNIQSSYGVTTMVKSSIRNWIAKSAEELL